MRNPFTWLALGGVIAVALAATLDAVRSDDPTSSADTVPPATVAPELATTAKGEVPLPPCTDVQLALTIDYIAAPAAVLRHVGGGTVPPGPPIRHGSHPHPQRQRRRASVGAGRNLRGPVFPWGRKHRRVSILPEVWREGAIYCGRPGRDLLGEKEDSGASMQHRDGRGLKSVAARPPRSRARGLLNPVLTLLNRGFTGGWL